jgi:hybrid cluster-associated redox disulfide protein
MQTAETAPPITGSCLVAEVLRRHPAALPVFLQRRMHCPGCPMASFMTLAEAAAKYGQDDAELLGALRSAAAGEAGAVA